MGETTVDDKWRITMPADVRDRIRKGQPLRVEKDGDRIIIKSGVSAEQFERKLKGCVRSSKIPPEKLKEIWGVGHAHD